MIRAYLFALDPTAEQEQAFRSHCGAQRVAYNWCLARVRANWAQRAAEQTYGLTGDQLTPWVNTSAYGLRLAWNAAKPDVAPWWAANSKEAYASGCANLSTALADRQAGRARMPRFKSKHRARLTCRFTTGAFGLGADRRHVRLPVIGAVRTGESTRKLARNFEAGTARIRSATLSWQRGRWHVSFSVETPDVEPAPRTGGRVLGVDVGSPTWPCCPPVSTCPTHDVSTPPAQPPPRTAHLRPPSRAGPAHPPRAVEPVAQGTATRRPDPHAGGCAAPRPPAQAHHPPRRRPRHHRGRGPGGGEHAAAGVRLIVADRWFASSKTCSGCSTAKTKLALSTRTYVCVACGLVLDRDENAARNLAALAADTGELRRELPAGSDVRPVVLARPAVAPPREESIKTQRRLREEAAR